MLLPVDINFKSQILFDLYEGRGITKKQFRSIPSIVKKYQQIIVIFKIIEKISDLHSYPGLHYEKLKGNLKMYSSIRLNKKYRLIFREVHSNLDFGIVDTLEIIEISNHYS
jgi:proteic killer suppression protein